MLPTIALAALIVAQAGSPSGSPAGTSGGSGTGTVTPQPVSQPFPRRSIDDADARAAAELRSHRELDDRKRGPDAMRDEILHRRRLQPVDAGAEDRNALDTSLRDLQPEAMAMPTGFTRVYVDPANPGQYVRANGALYAVFPYSEYQRTKKHGTIALIPTSTIFRIGLPARMPIEVREDPFQGAAPERHDERRSQIGAGVGRIDTRLDLYRGDDGAQAGRRAAAQESRALAIDQPRDEPDFGHRSLPTFLTDESYRRAFFASLRERRPATPPSDPAS